MQRRAIKAALFVMLPVIAQADQTVYIDQVGANLYLDVTQSGGGNNSVGDPTAVDPYFYLHGDNQSVTILQYGSGNQLVGGIQGDLTYFDLSMSGDYNVYSFTSNYASMSNFKWDILGMGNTISQEVGDISSSAFTNQLVTVDGNDNTINTTVSSEGSTQNLLMLGGNNQLTYQAQGYGSSLEGHTFTLSMTGDYNSVAVSQTSTLIADNLSITTTGSNQTVNIHQSD